MQEYKFCHIAKSGKRVKSNIGGKIFKNGKSDKSNKSDKSDKSVKGGKNDQDSKPDNLVYAK